MTNKNDDWRLKEYSPKGSSERWFFRKNLAPAIRPRHPNYGFIAYLTFAYTPRDASGLPSIDDEATLYKIEDEELSSLEVDGLAVHVAAAMKSGIKDLLFYTRNAEEFLARAELFRTRYLQFDVGCEVSHDPKWTHYEEFP